MTKGSCDFLLHIIAQLGKMHRVMTFPRLLIEEKPRICGIEPNPGIDVFLDLRLGALPKSVLT